MDFDFVVIGGGSAGYAAAAVATEQGLTTAVVEGGSEVGGLCILRGCMPSKTLLESAHRFQVLREASAFGLTAEGIGFDAAAIVARKRRLIAEFAAYRRGQLTGGMFEFVRGTARFVDAHTLDVALCDGGGRRITARSFLIATGSTINVPPIPGLAESGCLTSDDVLELEALPASLIVLGAGPVGLELAHYFNALGRKVTIVQRSGQLLKGVDADVAGVVEDSFRRRGAGVLTNTRLTRVEKKAGTFHVTIEHDGREKILTADAVLNALGRHPLTANLGLDQAGVELRGPSIKTNPHQQSTASHIFAAGDCCGPFEIVHVAIEQAELAARNACRILHSRSELESMDYRLKLFVVFTDPEVAVVGLTESEAAARGLTFRTASYPFNDHGKSLVMGATEGFVKLLVDQESREILGGAVVGPHGSDLIHEVVVAMRFRATADQLATTPHYHPTLSEIWTYPAAELASPPQIVCPPGEVHG